jgi:putative transposase
MPNARIFRYFKTSPEIIRLAVMMYGRYPLSLGKVEDLVRQPRRELPPALPTT